MVVGRTLFEGKATAEGEKRKESSRACCVARNGRALANLVYNDAVARIQCSCTRRDDSLLHVFENTPTCAVRPKAVDSALLRVGHTPAAGVGAVAGEAWGRQNEKRERVGGMRAAPSASSNGQFVSMFNCEEGGGRRCNKRGAAVSSNTDCVL